MIQLSKLQRIHGYLNSLIGEHGWVRILLTSNFHSVGQNAFRSGQLSPWTLRKKIHRHGLKSIINLRGPIKTPALLLEREICEEEGVAYYDLRLSSRDTHTPELLLQTKALLENIEYPALFHCMSGADRAGFISTLYLHWIESVPLTQTKQLKLWPYWHYRWAKTGLLDYFFEYYLRIQAETGITLEQWIRNEYRQNDIRHTFKSNPWLSAWIDRVLRRE